LIALFDWRFTCITQILYGSVTNPLEFTCAVDVLRTTTTTIVCLLDAQTKGKGLHFTVLVDGQYSSTVGPQGLLDSIVSLFVCINVAHCCYCAQIPWFGLLPC